jgi:hypothetical protein
MAALRGAKRPVKGQIGLLGEIYQYDLKYQPHLVRDPTTGLAVVVLRLPPNASQFDRLAAHQRASKLAQSVKPIMTKLYYIRQHRDYEIRRHLEEHDYDDLPIE